MVGGLVPDLIVDADEAHQGTNDVDLVLDIGVIYERDELDFSWLQAALDTAGFIPLASDGDWNWTTDVDGDVVVLQLLVDVDDSLRQQIPLPGAPMVTAMNVRGPRPVREGSLRFRLRRHPGGAVAAGRGRRSGVPYHRPRSDAWAAVAAFRAGLSADR